MNEPKKQKKGLIEKEREAEMSEWRQNGERDEMGGNQSPTFAQTRKKIGGVGGFSNEKEKNNRLGWIFLLLSCALMGLFSPTQHSLGKNIATILAFIRCPGN